MMYKNGKKPNFKNLIIFINLPTLCENLREKRPSGEKKNGNKGDFSHSFLLYITVFVHISTSCQVHHYAQGSYSIHETESQSWARNNTAATMGP